MAAPALLYATFVASTIYLSIECDVVVGYCYPPAVYGYISTVIWLLGSAIVCIFVLVVYIAAFVTAKRRQGDKRLPEVKITIFISDGQLSKQALKVRNRTLQSLMVVMLVYVGSWLLLVIIQIVVNTLGAFFCVLIVVGDDRKHKHAGVSSSTHFAVNVYGDYLTTISQSCNAYVYMWRSTEYRKAFCKVVFRIHCLVVTTNVSLQVLGITVKELNEKSQATMNGTVARGRQTDATGQPRTAWQ